jgi:6-phosphogluconate dehydrogenase
MSDAGSAKREFGMVGLGRMGGNLSLLAMEKGFRVVGYTLGGADEALVKAGLEEIGSVEQFRDKLATPRAVFLYIPAGPDVDNMLLALASVLDEGDLIADGGNSYWGDSIRRHARLAASGIKFVDLGTSGGIGGAREGACFMAGGHEDAVSIIEPVLVALSVPDGYVHAGPPGMGHYAKLVHNGIEFGMLQAIGEGVSMLEFYKDKLDIQGVLHCWRNGSVIRSWLIDLMEESYRTSSGADNIPPYVEDTGEVNWLVQDALRMEIPMPVISQSVMQLLSSRDEKKTWARAIAMMRHGFGGHPYGQSEPIKRERREGRIGEIYNDPLPERPAKKKAE